MVKYTHTHCLDPLLHSQPSFNKWVGAICDTACWHNSQQREKEESYNFHNKIFLKEKINLEQTTHKGKSYIFPTDYDYSFPFKTKTFKISMEIKPSFEVMLRVVLYIMQTLKDWVQLLELTEIVGQQIWVYMVIVGIFHHLDKKPKDI